MKRKLVLIAAVLTLSFSLVFGKGKFTQEQFVNLLNIEVGYSVSPNGYFFSDLSDWHGYGFNNPSELQAGGILVRLKEIAVSDRSTVLVSLYQKDNNKACSKLPIAGWATYMVYQHTGDKAFIKEMLPK